MLIMMGLQQQLTLQVFIYILILLDNNVFNSFFEKQKQVFQHFHPHMLQFQKPLELRHEGQQY